jgi:hypothetical protein
MTRPCDRWRTKARSVPRTSSGDRPRAPSRRPPASAQPVPPRERPAGAPRERPADVAESTGWNEPLAARCTGMHRQEGSAYAIADSRAKVENIICDSQFR